MPSLVGSEMCIRDRDNKVELKSFVVETVEDNQIKTLEIVENMIDQRIGPQGMAGPPGPQLPPGRGPRPRPRPTGRQADPVDRDRYWLARRSLRIWPIEGPNPRGSLMAFLNTRLGMEDAFLISMGQVTIKMICPSTRAGSRLSLIHI